MSGCANRCNSLLHHVRGTTIITILRKDASFFSTILNKLNKENVQEKTEVYIYWYMRWIILQP